VDENVLGRVWQDSRNDSWSRFHGSYAKDSSGRSRFVGANERGGAVLCGGHTELPELEIAAPSAPLLPRSGTEGALRVNPN
jgi:hypothetical protein